MNLLQVAAWGAVIGAPLGYAMQRTNLCFNSAYREAILGRDTVLLRGILLAILVQMVALAWLVQFNVRDVSLNVVPFFWLANVVGGFVFGLAMVYAEGCSSTVWYRVGNGNLGSLVTLVGFALGEEAASFGLLRGWREALQGPEIVLTGAGQATLPDLLGVSPWLVILPLAGVVGLWLARSPAGAYLGGWDWRQAGLVLGLIGARAWLVAWPTGWHYGVGVVGATAPFVRLFTQGTDVLNWGSFMVLSMPAGAFLAAWRRREFRWQVPNVPSALRMFSAGAVMGVSATLAGGCNIGHGFTGLPTLALSSLTATLCTFLGAWIGNYVRFVRPYVGQVAPQG